MFPVKHAVRWPAVEGGPSRKWKPVCSFLWCP